MAVQVQFHPCCCKAWYFPLFASVCELLWCEIASLEIPRALETRIAKLIGTLVGYRRQIVVLTVASSGDPSSFGRLVLTTQSRAPGQRCTGLHRDCRSAVADTWWPRLPVSVSPLGRSQAQRSIPGGQALQPTALCLHRTGGSERDGRPCKGLPGRYRPLGRAVGSGLGQARPLCLVLSLALSGQ